MHYGSKLGISGKMLRIIRSMYNIVKSCVKHCGQFSDLMDISIGLKQGENLSPIMFSLFLEDLEIYLQGNVDSGLSLNDLTLILLLFADDMVLLGSSPEDLQISFNKLYEYCNLWGLEVNTEKTKVVVFRKRGRVRENESGSIIIVYLKWLMILII